LLDMYKKSFTDMAGRYARPLLKVKPNSITWAAFAFGAMAGLSFAFVGTDMAWPLLVAVLMIILNGILDIADGWVARETGSMSRQGDFLDHAVDRGADMLIMVGIAISPLCNTTIGLLAAISVLLVSYMGTQAQAVGAKRDYGGILGRADRMLLLGVGSVVQYILLTTGLALPSITGMPYYFMDYIMIWFLIAGIITAVFRGQSTWRTLGDEEE